MLLSQPPVMRRTTSMSGGMAVDVPHDHVGDDHGDGDDSIKNHHHQSTNNNLFGSKEHELYHAPNSYHITTNMNHSQKKTQNQTSSNPPSPHHRTIQTPHFLRTCGLCKCRLAPGRDIYMYRGDTAFCSLECREQRMKEDSRKEKWNKMVSNKESHRTSPRATITTAAAATAKASAKDEAAACT